MVDTSAPRFPSRLTAPAPGWTTSADVVVIGSGIAGLTAALRLYGQVGRILVAARVGTTRLIDNLPIVFARSVPPAGTASAASTTSEGNT